MSKTLQHNKDEDYELLHQENKRVKLNLIETPEINRLKKLNNLFHDQIEISLIEHI